MSEDLESGLDMLNEIKDGAVPPELAMCEAEAVLNYIEQLQQENKTLKATLKCTTHCFDEEEHRRLNNILNGFLEDIPYLLEIINRNEENIKIYQDEWIAIRSVEYILKELEGSDE